MAVTEHNTVSHLIEMAGRPEPPSPLVIPAMEITTYHGHANALGIRRWHDFRCRTAAQMAALCAEVQAEGALFVVNHPKVTGPPEAVHVRSAATIRQLMLAAPVTSTAFATTGVPYETPLATSAGVLSSEGKGTSPH